jgi:aminoglycoside 2'-N-acetyltransferase I
MIRSMTPRQASRTPLGQSGDMVEVVVAEDDGWDRELLAAVREMTFAAFTGRFDEHDWEHTLGGARVVALADGVPVAAGAVVPRTLLVGEREVHAGYVEGVAAAADRQGSGLGTAVMRAVDEAVRDRYELGVLSTSAHAFYERLGWERWQGPTYVRDGDTVVRTEDEDAGIMVLRIDGSPFVNLTAALTCDARSGDDW